MKNKKIVLKSNYPVEFFSLERKGVIIYCVGYPAKFGGTETTQFLVKEEAEKEYEKYCKFFCKKP